MNAGWDDLDKVVAEAKNEAQAVADMVKHAPSGDFVPKLLQKHVPKPKKAVLVQHHLRLPKTPPMPKAASKHQLKAQLKQAEKQVVKVVREVAHPKAAPVSFASGVSPLAASYTSESKPYGSSYVSAKVAAIYASSVHGSGETVAAASGKSVPATYASSYASTATTHASATTPQNPMSWPPPLAPLNTEEADMVKAQQRLKAHVALQRKLDEDKTRIANERSVKRHAVVPPHIAPRTADGGMVHPDGGDHGNQGRSDTDAMQHELQTMKDKYHPEDEGLHLHRGLPTDWTTDPDNETSLYETSASTQSHGEHSLSSDAAQLEALRKEMGLEPSDAAPDEELLKEPAQPFPDAPSAVVQVRQRTWAKERTVYNRDAGIPHSVMAPGMPSSGLTNFSSFLKDTRSEVLAAQESMQSMQQESEEQEQEHALQAELRAARKKLYGLVKKTTSHAHAKQIVKALKLKATLRSDERKLDADKERVHDVHAKIQSLRQLTETPRMKKHEEEDETVDASAAEKEDEEEDKTDDEDAFDEEEEDFEGDSDDESFVEATSESEVNLGNQQNCLVLQAFSRAAHSSMHGGEYSDELTEDKAALKQLAAASTKQCLHVLKDLAAKAGEDSLIARALAAVLKDGVVVHSSTTDVGLGLNELGLESGEWPAPVVKALSTDSEQFLRRLEGSFREEDFESASSASDVLATLRDSR